MLRKLGVRSIVFAKGALVAACVAMAGGAEAALENFPNKRVHVISAHAAGSGPDVALRLVAEQLSKKWNQPVVVENKPGGSGFIAINALRQAEPDAHTLLLFDAVHVTTNPFTFSQLPYDPDEDLALIVPLFRNGFFVAVGADSPYQSVDDVIKAARDRSGELTYGSWFVGSPGHLGALRLEKVTDTSMTHVPYKEMGRLYGDVSTGQVDWAFGSAASAGPMEQADKVRFIAYSGSERSELYPDVPLVSESETAKDYTLFAWIGIAAPKGTSLELRQKLNADFIEALQSDQVRERFKAMGYEHMLMTVDEFAAYVKSERDTWGEIIKAANLKLD